MNTKFLIMLIVLTIILGGIIFGFSVKPNYPDFKIRIIPDVIKVPQGSSRNLTVTITLLNELNSTINLTISRIPQGVSAFIHPSSLTPSVNGNIVSTLTIMGLETTVSSDVLLVEARSGELSKSVSVTVSVYQHDLNWMLSSKRIAHWSYDGYGMFTLDDMVNKTLDLEADLVVLTLKDSYGNVYFGDFWNSNNDTKIDLSLFVEKFHAKGIRVIGDVAALHDPHWIATHDDSGLYIWNQTIQSYVRSDSWIEPYYVYADIKGAQGYSKYMKDVIKATLDLGVDGINFDDQLIYPYTEYTKPDSVFCGSLEFKEWAGIPQNYTGYETYFAEWNETDHEFFNKRADVIDLIAKEWTDYIKQYEPGVAITVFLNPKDHIAHGVRLSTYSEFFDMLYVQAYSSYVDFESLKNIRDSVSKRLYVFIYALLGASYPPIYVNDPTVMRDIVENAVKLEYDGVGIFTANKAYEDDLNDLVKELFTLMTS